MSLAFYGINTDVDLLQDFYFRTAEFFEAVCYAPDRLAVFGPGHTSKVGNFERINCRLEKAGFATVEGFEMYVSSQSKLASAGSIAECLCRTTNDSCAVICVPASKLIIAELFRFSNQILSRLNPEYGIGYLRDGAKGPAFYAIGMGVESDEETEDEDVLDNIFAWGQIGMSQQLYRQGLVRDVYTWNYLAPVHLNRRIESMTLENWIQSAPDRGTLRKICEHAIWEVPPSKIPKIRTALSKAKLRFDHRDWQK